MDNFSFSPLGYFHPFSSRIYFQFTWTIFFSLHLAIFAIRFCSRRFFYSHGQFFFLSIGLFPSVFIQNLFSIHMDNFFFSPLGYFAIRFCSRRFFLFTQTIFLSLHWAILTIRFFSRKLFHSHGQFVRAATRRLGESKKGGSPRFAN
jgi:hypothetical protein